MGVAGVAAGQTEAGQRSVSSPQAAGRAAAKPWMRQMQRERAEHRGRLRQLPSSQNPPPQVQEKMFSIRVIVFWVAHRLSKPTSAGAGRLTSTRISWTSRR